MHNLIYLAIIGLYSVAAGVQFYALRCYQFKAFFFTGVLSFWTVILHALALSIFLIVIMPHHTSQLSHILLSIASITVLSIAGFQAILLAIQERQLRIKHALGIWKNIPPLETMESILFHMISLGFVLLTILLISSFYSYRDILWHQFLDKAVLAVSAWVVFASLLLGRKFLGWRGKSAIYFTLGGLMLLVCIFYFNYFWAM